MYDPEQSVGFLVNYVARLMRRNFNRRAQQLGLSLSQWQVLAHLWRQQGVNQVTLADCLEIQPITLGRVIDKLEEAGVVERRPDPDDRRAFKLFLTDTADPLLAQMLELAFETRREALAGLSEEHQRILIESLRHMKSNLLEVEGCTVNTNTKKTVKNEL